MQISTESLSLAVATIDTSSGWVFGTVHEGAAPPSPRAPWVDTRKALVRAIKQRTLPTTVGPFFLPLKDNRGLFREVSSSVLTDFLSVDRNSEDSILYFVRRYGVFRFADLDPKKRDAKMPRAVRARWSTATGQGKIPFAFSVASFQRDYETVDRLWQIAAAVRERDAVAAKSSLASFDLIEGAAEHAKDYPSPLHDAEQLVAAGIAIGLETARFAPVNFQGIMVPGAVTGFVLDAIYLQLMEQVTQGHQLRRCRNSRCQSDASLGPKAFIPDRSDQWYCSRKCQNLANRYRQLGKSIDVEGAKNK